VKQPRQQINLYQETVPAWRPFGSATLALAAVAVCCCFAAIWGFGTWQVDRLQRAVGDLQRQQGAQQTMLNSLGSLSAAGSSAADLKSRVQELTAALAARERALTLLQEGAAGNTSGFSAPLAALARHPMPGLWLRQITLSHLTGSTSLAGQVLSPDWLPRYLHVLGTEPALASIRFDSLVIERPVTDHAPTGHAAPSSHAAAFKFRAEGTTGAPQQLADTQVPRS
jgi:MSHA biogenesis protein MshI